MSELNQKPEDIKKKLRLLTTPLSAYNIPRWLIFLFGLVGLIYILNPTLGVFELFPDNLPIIGNLDEGLAFLLVWASLVELFEGKKHQPPQEPPSDVK